jgi:hypothetical protein
MGCAVTGHDEAVASKSIVGGFVLIPVSSLIGVWRACQKRPFGMGEFRAWLAAHEMTARRCKLAEGRQPAYTLDELAGLLGVTRKRAGGSVRRLESAGLIGWSDGRIAFPAQPEQVDGDAPEIVETLSRGRGSLAIPRRILRHLVHGARPALIATALGVLLRCLSRRRAGFDGRGRLKASWAAVTFGVDLRGVKRGRRELVALGWITPRPSDAWATRRWGPAYTIDLDWERLPAGNGSRLPPIPAAAGPAIATPRSDREPLQERNRNQEPGPEGPAGVQTSRLHGEDRKLPEAESLPTPRLDDVRVEDLERTDRLLELYGQAVTRGIVTASEADRLRFVGAAEHAMAIGEANPAGLFAFLVRGRCWRYLTQADEDRATARLKAHRRSLLPPAAHPGLAPDRPARAAPSDGEIVREVRAAAIRAGVFRDPFEEFQRLHPGWTRDRWDRAVEGCGGRVSTS